MLQEWEDTIYELTNRSKIYDKYMTNIKSVILEKQMQETKDQYYETMHDMAIYRIIVIECENVCNKDLLTISSYKREKEYPSRTVFATKFSRNRCAFAKQYYLSHQLIKNIVVKAHLLLPEKFCDFGCYRSFEYIDFNKYIN